MVNTEVLIALGVCVAVTGVIYVLHSKRQQQRRREEEAAAASLLKNEKKENQKVVVDSSKIEELKPAHVEVVNKDTDEYKAPKAEEEEYEEDENIEELVKHEEVVVEQEKEVKKEEIKEPVVEVIRPQESSTLPESVPLIPLEPAVVQEPKKEEATPVVVVEEPKKDEEVPATPVQVEEPTTPEEAKKEEPKHEEVVVETLTPVQVEEQPKKESDDLKDSGYGKVNLTIFYDASRSRFRVTVHSAENLINTDKNSLSDPYARLTLEPDVNKETKRKTRVIKDSLNPEWQEDFEWTMTRAEVESKRLEVNLKDEKSIFQKQDSVFLGRVTIDLKHADIYGTQPLTKSYWLQAQHHLTGLLKNTHN